MKLARTVAPLALTLLAAVGTAQVPRLVIESDAPIVTFRVAGPEVPFVGGVLLSLAPDLTHYLVDLPPMLTDHVVLGFAFGEDEIALTLAREALPIVVPIYAQGVVFDGTAIQATEVAVMKLEPWSDG